MESTRRTGGRTEGGGVALEGRCCQTEARGLGSAAGGDALSSAVLAWGDEGFIATVPVGTPVLARHENRPVAYSARGLQHATGFSESAIQTVDAECHPAVSWYLKAHSESANACSGQYQREGHAAQCRSPADATQPLHFMPMCLPSLGSTHNTT